MNEFARALRRWRRLRGIKQTHAAELFGVNADNYRYIRLADGEVLLARLDERFESAHRTAGHISDVDFRAPQLDAPCLEPSNNQQVVDQCRELVGSQVDVAEQAMHGR